MKYMITGGCGFLGSNIAAEILSKGLGELLVFDNLSRLGSQANLEWLRSRGDFKFLHGDIRSQNDVDGAIGAYKPDCLFHLSGQVAMTTSIMNPRLDFEVNAMGSFNVVDAIRRLCPQTAMLYSSTNKVYGDLEWEDYKENDTRYQSQNYPNGFPESIPLDFHSPYGCSKGAADQVILDAHRIFGMRTAVFRHSSMFGGRQFSTADQGWIGWFCLKALERKKGSMEPFTISGNGKQVRDVLFASDMVELYLSAAANIQKIQGQAFNIGGGYENSLSLLELFGLLEAELGIRLAYEKLPPRESDQKVFIADLAKIRGAIGWKPKVDKLSGLRMMLDWVS